MRQSGQKVHGPYRHRNKWRLLVRNADGTFLAGGLAWRDAGALGILMNTRGLMELVILNVGLEIGVLSRTLFTMMIIMALVTTIMTTPLLRLIRPDLTKGEPATAGPQRALQPHAK